MVLRNVAKTFSLEQQRVEINLIAADLHSLSQVSETDPIFGAAPAASITAQQITNWDLAYTWGDHSTVGYLTSFTETDPVFIASPAGSITQQHITNWDTAYNWGNHANAGYLTSNAIVVADVAPATPASGDLWWNSISGVLKIYYQDVDTSQWVDASPTASSAQGAKVITSDLPPMNPVQGDLWWDSSDGSLKIYFSDGDSNQWVDASHASPGAIISGGGASVTTSDVPPSNAADGDLWWKSDVGVLKIYYDDGNTQQWVDASPSGSGGGGSSYTNSDVDAHLNRSTATTGQVLSWNGSDYDWVAQSSGGGGSGISLTDLSVTQNSAGTAALTYNNTNGVFSYTPPDLSGYLTAETDPLFNASAASGIAASDITNWDAAFSWGDHANAGYLTSNAIVVADVAPTSPASGDLWWHSGSGRLKIYYQDVDTTQWVDASPPLASNAIQVQSDWGETDSNNVAFIQNKPTIPAAQVNSDWNAVSGVEQILNKPTLFDGDYDNLTNKPTLFDGDYNNLTNKPTIPSNTGIVSVKDYGAVGDGSTDDTSAIQSALNSNHKAIYFPTGDYVISSTLTSSLNGRKIYGEGTITTTATALSNVGSSILLKAIEFTNAEYVDFSLDCDGNNLIEVFAQFNQCLDPHIHHCRVRDLESLPWDPNGGGGGKAIAFELFNQGSNSVDTGAKITDNYITNLIAHDDNQSDPNNKILGRGMARAIAFDTDRTLNKPILIADNVIDTVAGDEGDAISVMSLSGSTYYNANVFITGNHIKDFNRRGCKIKFNSAVISNNTFYNTWTSSPVNESGASVVQGAVDLDRGSDHIVTGNKFINTEFMTQIKIVAAGSERVDNCVIKDNVFTRIGFQTTSTLIYVSTSTSTDASTQGVNLTIKDNSFDVPGFSDTCIRVNRTTNVIVTDNTGIFSNTNAVGVSFGACHNVLSNNNNFLNPNGSINNVGTLSELDNVNVTNATSGQVLQYDGSNWNNSPGLNVNINNPTAGQVLKYNGSAWINDTDAT